MAKVTYGPIVSEGRGKVGDVVLNRNRGGNFARALRIPEPAVTTHNLLSAVHLDTTPATPPARGSSITGQGAGALWKELALGTAGKVFTSDGTDALWSDPALPCKVIDITSAQIKDFHNTPIEVIPTPGANKAIQVVSATACYKYGTVVYATLSGSLALVTVPATTATTQWSQVLLAFIDQASNQIRKPATSALTTTTANVADKPLYLYGTSATQPTNGDGTLRLHITYLVIDVP
jgi:hypothetical protein